MLLTDTDSPRQENRRIILCSIVLMEHPKLLQNVSCSMPDLSWKIYDNSFSRNVTNGQANKHRWKYNLCHSAQVKYHFDNKHLCLLLLSISTAFIYWNCYRVMNWRTYFAGFLSANVPLKWRHDEHDGVSNHQPHDCLLDRSFKVQIKENIKAPRNWLLRGKFTGDRWISHTKGQ